MAEQVTATLVVDFTAGAAAGASNGFLKLELDSQREGNLNGGKTSFYPNSNAYYLLFKGSNVSIINHDASKGSRAAQGSVSIPVEDEVVTFSGSDTATLPYPVTGNFSAEWDGRTFDVNGARKTLNYSLVDDVTIQLDQPGHGALVVNYTTSGQLFRLSSVPDRATVIAVGEVS